MKAEERLRLQTKETEYELAKQAIALLRELVEDMDTFRRGETTQLVLVDWLEKARAYLEGADEASSD